MWLFKRIRALLCAPLLLMPVIIAPARAGATDVYADANASPILHWQGPRQEGPQLPHGFDEAPTLGDVAPELGWSVAEVAAFRQGIAQRFSADLTQDHGSMTEEHRQILGRETYISPDDLQTFVLARSTRADVHLVTVPVGASVSVEGAAYLPPVTTSNSLQEPPTYEGPWDDPTFRFFPHSYSVVDKPSLAEWPDCVGRTVGELRSRTYSQKLTEATDHAYYGFFKANVAEIVEGSGGLVCQDYLDQFRSFFNIWADVTTNPDQYFYVDQSPGTLPGTNCQTTDVEVETSVAGVSATISRSFERCDNWDVTGFLENQATEQYGVEYENNGRCSDEDRAAAFAMVVQGPEEPVLIHPGVLSHLFIDPEQKSGLATVC